MCKTHRMASDDPHARRRVGAWLRDSRIRAGYRTTSDLARALGINQASISAYETGKTPLPEDRIPAFANALRIPVIDLRRGLELWVPDGLEPRPMTPEEAIEADDTLGPGGRRMMLSLLREVRTNVADGPTAYDPDRTTGPGGPARTSRAPGREPAHPATQP